MCMSMLTHWAKLKQHLIKSNKKEQKMTYRFNHLFIDYRVWDQEITSILTMILRSQVPKEMFTFQLRKVTRKNEFLKSNNVKKAFQKLFSEDDMFLEYLKQLKSDYFKTKR